MAKHSTVSKENRMIYIGPNLGSGRLAHATVFCGGFPEHVVAIIKAHPWMANFFVPVESYTVKLAERNRKGTALYLYSKRTKEV